MIRIVRYAIGPTIHSHRKISPRVMEIVKSEYNIVFGDVKQKWKRFTHSQDNTFYAVTLFLHRGYEHSTRFLSLAKKLVERTIIWYTHMYIQIHRTKLKFSLNHLSIITNHVSFAGWTREKLLGRENFEELGIDWHLPHCVLYRYCNMTRCVLNREIEISHFFLLPFREKKNG